MTFNQRDRQRIQHALKRTENIRVTLCTALCDIPSNWQVKPLRPYQGERGSSPHPVRSNEDLSQLPALLVVNRFKLVYARATADEQTGTHRITFHWSIPESGRKPELLSTPDALETMTRLCNRVYAINLYLEEYSINFFGKRVL